MRALHRMLAMTAAVGAAITMSAAGALTAASAGTTSARPAGASPAVAGRAGSTITLANHAEFDGYDAATDAAGTTYIGWIASSDSAADRTVYLCVLPRGKTSCAGGVKSTPSLSGSSAAGLHVLVTGVGKVTLVWSHTTTASESVANGDEITTATGKSDGSLSGATDMATAPSFGTLLDATLGPQGSIWVVEDSDAALTKVQIRPGLSSPAVMLATPYEIGNAQIRFAGSTAVLAIQKAGAISYPVAYAHNSGHGWSGFRKLAHTWTAAANLGLASTRSGVRLLASVGNADYWPVVSRFTGSTFTRPQLTGDRHDCAPSSHDPVGDASGRMADVSNECDKLAVANLTDTLHAAVVRFGDGGTLAGGIPQITTTPRGRGWVVWGIESSSANKLLAVPVLLPGRLRTVTGRSHSDKVLLTGPASCLPPVTVHLRLRGEAASHWHVVSHTLRLDGALHSATLKGASLAAGRRYTLTGRVVFGDGSARRAVTAKLTFLSCPNS